MKVVPLASIVACLIFVVGCKAPGLGYVAPSPRLNPAGPSVVVYPVTDQRLDRKMDKVYSHNHLVDVQYAIVAELRSMNAFKDVSTQLNAKNAGDLRLAPKLSRLEWDVPDDKKIQTQAFLVGLTTGAVGGSIFLATGVDVYGHSLIEIEVQTEKGNRMVFKNSYHETVNRRMKKASYDTAKTKAEMSAAALKECLNQLKIDLEKELPRIQTSLPTAEAASVTSP